MIPVEPFLRQENEPVRPAPPRTRTGIGRLFFGDLVSTLVTVLVGAIVLAAVPQLVSWAVVNSIWSGGPDECRAGGGACWAFLREKHPFILFGIYPPDERWRPIAVVVLFILLTIWTLPTAHWTRRTLVMWAVGIITALVLMSGGILGLAPVPSTSWGGLPVTILLTVLSLALGFPFAVMLALGRRSELPVVRILSVSFIEIVRGLPLLSLLFIASVLLPIMLPEGLTVDNLFRALAALTFSSAAYLAEVLRGGLQGVPDGQAEAARALGLGWWRTTRAIVLPQAIRNVIPPLTNTVVVIVKNTSLVLIVGLFDLLSAGRAALADPEWPTPYIETYLMVAVIYFVICFGISTYSLSLERKMVHEVRR